MHGECGTYRREEKYTGILTGKHKKRRELGRLRHRLKIS
jgi:hypothetical protein